MTLPHGGSRLLSDGGVMDGNVHTDSPVLVHAPHYKMHTGTTVSSRNGCPYVERSSQSRDYRRVRDICSIPHNQRFHNCRSEQAVYKHSRLCLIAVLRRQGGDIRCYLWCSGSIRERGTEPRGLFGVRMNRGRTKIWR